MEIFYDVIIKAPLYKLKNDILKIKNHYNYLKNECKVYTAKFNERAQFIMNLAE